MLRRLVPILLTALLTTSASADVIAVFGGGSPSRLLPVGCTDGQIPTYSSGAWICATASGTGDMLLGTSQTVTANKSFADTTLRLNGATSGVTTLVGTDTVTATITMPSATATLPGLGLANTWTTGNLFSPGTDVAPLTLRRNVGATANILQIQEEDNDPLITVSGTGDLTFSGTATLAIPNSITLPGSCSAGQVYQDTDATSGSQLYACEGGSFVLQAGGGGGGASTALDNLAAVAINTSLISDTAATDDLGSTTVPWRVGYINSLIAKSTGSGTPTMFEVTANTGTGIGNTVAGTTAGDSLTTGSNHTLYGEAAGTSLTTGSSTTALGYGAVDAVTACAGCTAVGTNAGGASVIGSYLTAVGDGAANTQLGTYNAGFGDGTFVGISNTGAEGNTALGPGAGSVNTSGDYDFNIWLGRNAGSTQTTVTDHCIAIGTATDCTASNETFIGVSTSGYQSKTTIGRGANGQQDLQGVTTEAITLNTGGTTTNSSGNLAPANSIIDAIACRITTEITTATEWALSVTGGSAFNQIGTTDTTASTMTAGTTAIFVPPDHNSQYNATATTITVTTTGTPGAGVVRCTVHYRSFVAPTS